MLAALFLVYHAIRFACVLLACVLLACVLLACILLACVLLACILLACILLASCTIYFVAVSAHIFPTMETLSSYHFIGIW